MSWTPRTTAPTQGTPPYDWSATSIYECTWYAYWRVQEEGYTPPCWYSGSGSSGTGYYTNAKYWLDHYRDPWEVKNLNYSPVAGDIIIFTGTYGHCVVVEAVNGDGTLTITDYNLIAGDHTFGRKTNYVYGERIYGAVQNTGACIGALHYPNGTPPTPPYGDTLEIVISPEEYRVTMLSDQTYVDFTFNIVISGIPNGETVSGGNTYPDLERVYNTGWTYTDYTVDGLTYRYARKTQTLRYYREGLGAYNTIKHMYYNISKSTGIIDSDTLMYIDVKPQAALMAILKKKKQENRKHVKFTI
ncbi:MAG: CHAP domain-containing protein [Erysipelotrichaceae bacterium]|nr:CHAP domain-containing protein [Erysipelotrichaceae bacterium]